MLLIPALLACLPAQQPDLCIQAVTSTPLTPRRAFSADGRLYVSGVADFGIDQLLEETTDGWAAIPGAFEGSVLAVAATPLGLVAGGTFDAVDGMPVNGVAVRGPGGWIPLGAGFDAPYRVAALEFHGGELFAAGEFTTSQGVAVSNVARWDGTRWRNMAGGTDGPVRDLASFGGTLVVAGEFGTAGAQAAANVAAWDGSGFVAAGSLPPAFDLACSGGARPRLLAAATGVYELQAGTWSEVGALPLEESIHAEAVAFAEGEPVAVGPWVTFCKSSGGGACAAAARYDGNGGWARFLIDEFGPSFEQLGLVDVGGPALLTGLCDPFFSCSLLRLGDVPTIQTLQTSNPTVWYADTAVELRLACIDSAAGGVLRIGDAAPVPVEFPATGDPFAVFPPASILPGIQHAVFEQSGTVSEPRPLKMLPFLTATVNNLFGNSEVAIRVEAATELGTLVALYSPVLDEIQLPIDGVHGLLGLDIPSLKVAGVTDLVPSPFGQVSLTVPYDPAAVPPATSLRTQCLVVEAMQFSAWTNVDEILIP